MNISYKMLKYGINIGKKIDKSIKMEYIYKIELVRKGILITMNNVDISINKKSLDDAMECGYYYVPSEVCKNLIITAGLSGVHTAKAIKRIQSRFRDKKGAVGDIIPALRSMDQDIISYYAGELAESIVYAAGNGKGVDIAIGYPKIMIFLVN